MKGIFAIYDRETDYANHLTDYIKRKQKRSVQVRVFTNHESLSEYAKQNPVEILLINESLPVEEIKQDNIKNICILTENTYSSENSVYPVIYKYQSAEIILKEMFGYFSYKDMQDRLKNSFEEKGRLISVFSAGEDAARQLFAFSLANQYSLSKNTLYINVNTLQVLSGLSGFKADKGLSEFIYYLKQNNPNLIHKMNDSITKRNNLDYMEGVSFGPDLYELTAEDINRWLSILIQYTEYEVIIFDVGCYFQAGLELFRKSSQILFWLGNCNWEQLQFDDFKEQMKWSGNEEILEKTIVVPVSDEVTDRYRNIRIENFDYETGNCSLAAGYITS